VVFGFPTTYRFESAYLLLVREWVSQCTGPVQEPIGPPKFLTLLSTHIVPTQHLLAPPATSSRCPSGGQVCGTGQVCPSGCHALSGPRQALGELTKALSLCWLLVPLRHRRHPFRALRPSAGLSRETPFRSAPMGRGEAFNGDCVYRLIAPACPCVPGFPSPLLAIKSRSVGLSEQPDALDVGAKCSSRLRLQPL